MKKLVALMMFAVMVVAFSGGYALAQDAMQKDSHAQAAEDFLLAMETPQQLSDGINSMVDMMLQSQPMMMPYRQTIKDFYVKYLSWDALKDDYISITKDLLDESDLKQLTAFFKTEAGQKFIEKQPEMFKRTSELGYNIMQKHQQELMDILQKEAEKYAPAKGSTSAAGASAGAATPAGTTK